MGWAGLSAGEVRVESARDGPFCCIPPLGPLAQARVAGWMTVVRGERWCGQGWLSAAERTVTAGAGSGGTRLARCGLSFRPGGCQVKCCSQCFWFSRIWNSLFPLPFYFFPHLQGQTFQGEAAGYSVETLIIVILAPVTVLIVFSAVAVLIIRRIQKNHMERLNSRDAEYGTIEGLIASNVGDSTLAVSTCVVESGWAVCLPSARTLQTRPRPRGDLWLPGDAAPCQHFRGDIPVLKP